jgi:hypothetical protein
MLRRCFAGVNFTRMSGRGQAGFQTSAAVEQNHLPDVSRLVMAQDVNTAIVAAQLEVAVGRVQPAIADLAYLDGALTDEEAHWSHIRAMTGVTLDADRGRSFFIKKMGVKAHFFLAWFTGLRRL